MVRRTISIHALLAESDRQKFYAQRIFSDFYPRSPCGERQPRVSYGTGYFYFYPRSPCGERPSFSVREVFANFISIHALLAESDNWPRGINLLCLYFYPRSPCGERLEEVSGDTWQRDFYPRSPCGERPARCIQRCCGTYYFYPRSPCGERPSVHKSTIIHDVFLSTLSLRRAT